MKMKSKTSRSLRDDPFVMVGALICVLLIYANYRMVMDMFATVAPVKMIDAGVRPEGEFTVSARSWYYENEAAENGGAARPAVLHVRRHSSSMNIRMIERADPDPELAALKDDPEKYNQALAEKYGE